MKDFRFIETTSPEYLEELYQKYLQDPHLVDETWRAFFRGYEFFQLPENLPPKNFEPGAQQKAETHSDNIEGTTSLTAKISQLIKAYRQKSHWFSQINPLNAKEVRASSDVATLQEMEPSFYGISEEDLKQTISWQGGAVAASQLVAKLKKTYLSTIAYEFSYITNSRIRSWLEQKIETDWQIDVATQKYILSDLCKAETFENFLHTKYVGQKRFSLEGGIALVPALRQIIELAAQLGVKETAIAMAHRGRLNSLVHILQKPYENIFSEFDGGQFANEVVGSGDVKYHLGFSSDFKTKVGASMHVALSFNPSHLEIVNPVLAGNVRAKIQNRYEMDTKKLLPILVHGDAALAGQGVGMELLNMSRLPAYKVGGTIHVVVNNQVGFTTDLTDARSTVYCTDLAKMTESPVFHVNGDDPEAVVRVMQLALEYRQTFQSDVFVDIICYRKYGHNEGDEPRFTQPVMYTEIDRHNNPYKIYAEQLINLKVISQVDVQAEQEKLKQELSDKLDLSRKSKQQMVIMNLQGEWKNIKRATEVELEKSVDTKVSKELVQKVAKVISSVPEKFTPIAKAVKLLKDREDMAFADKDMDWGMAENLAYATLVAEGTSVRMTGQDVRRGTFSHRHGVLVDTQTGEKRILLNGVSSAGAKMELCDSLLSEEAVLGFEYGYSLASPNSLNIWEAQFGDFANGAQVIMDQFIASGETKWLRMSGLVLLLPHGYEGQGPEHSSARLERFLQACAENNMFVMNLSRPDQIFHALRRQVKANYRKPMVVMSPKSLLRHPKAICKVTDLTSGGFREIIADPRNVKKPKRVIFCTGKIYYELEDKRVELKQEVVAIVRLEQLYPLPEKQIQKILAEYANHTELYWVQEEPENMGAWWFIKNKFEKMGLQLKKISRAEAAAPATGFHKRYSVEQQEILTNSFKGL